MSSRKRESGTFHSIWNLALSGRSFFIITRFFFIFNSIDISAACGSNKYI